MIDFSNELKFELHRDLSLPTNPSEKKDSDFTISLGVFLAEHAVQMQTNDDLQRPVFVSDGPTRNPVQWSRSDSCLGSD